MAAVLTGAGGRGRATLPVPSRPCSGRPGVSRHHHASRPRRSVRCRATVSRGLSRRATGLAAPAARPGARSDGRARRPSAGGGRPRPPAAAPAFLPRPPRPRPRTIRRVYWGSPSERVPQRSPPIARSRGARWTAARLRRPPIPSIRHVTRARASRPRPCGRVPSVRRAAAGRPSCSRTSAGGGPASRPRSSVCAVAPGSPRRPNASGPAGCRGTAAGPLHRIRQ